MPVETLKEAAQLALDVQNACNLGPILKAWTDCQSVLRLVCGSNANASYRRHPINILFASKVSSLMVVATDCVGGVYALATVDGQDLFNQAYDWCQQKTQE